MSERGRRPSCIRTGPDSEPCGKPAVGTFPPVAAGAGLPDEAALDYCDEHLAELREAFAGEGDDPPVSR